MVNRERLYRLSWTNSEGVDHFAYFWSEDDARKSWNLSWSKVPKEIGRPEHHITEIYPYTQVEHL